MSKDNSFNSMCRHAEDAMKRIALTLDEEMLWLSGAYNMYILIAQKEYPLTGKIKNVWDKRTKSGKYLNKIKQDLLKNHE